MLKGFKIFHKLAVSYFLIGAITVIVISLIFYSAFKEALIERTSAQLLSVNILKKLQIEKYFRNQENDLALFAENPDLQKAASVLAANDASALDPALEQRLRKLIYDLHGKEMVLLNKNGKIVFPRISSGTLFQLIRDSAREVSLERFIHAGRSAFTLHDATPEISSHATTVLISHPLKVDGELVGSIVYKRDFSEIEQILFERTGMGNTGESYLVGADSLMRSSSRFFPHKNPFTIRVATTAVREGLKGKEQTGILPDYRDVLVLSAYSHIKLRGLEWVILSEIDYREALRPVEQIRNYIIVTGLVLVLIIVLVTLFLSRKISRPIVQLKETILDLSQGILPEEVKVMTTDEIGDMTIAIDKLIQGLRRTSGFAYDIGNGNFKSVFQPLSPKDTLGISLMQMRDKLRALQQREAMMMRERSSALLEGQEKERRRIAMELHDGIGQMLTVIRFRISALEGMEEFQKEVKTLLDDTIAEVRRISNNVMPNVLLDFGLVSALKTLCQNTEKYTSISVDFEYIQESDLEVNFESSVSLYRIAQEAINNAVKYAHPSLIEVVLKVNGSGIQLEITDDGKGFDIQQYDERGKLSNGIKNMKERVNLLQGKFNITSEPDMGTHISVNIPVAGGE